VTFNYAKKLIKLNPHIYSLLTFHRYQFRVSAENGQGVSAPCEPTAVLTTLESELVRRRKRWTEDENGRRRRGQEGLAPADYDKCVSDPWAKYPNGPPPFDYKLGSVYDFYDIFEGMYSSFFLCGIEILVLLWLTGFFFRDIELFSYYFEK